MNWLRKLAYPIPQTLTLLIWVSLFNLQILSRWGGGVKNFVLLLSILALFHWATRRWGKGRPWSKGDEHPHRQVTVAFLALLTGILLFFHGRTLLVNLSGPVYEPMSDIGANTECAARLFFYRGENPYTHRCQLEHDVSDAYGVQIEEGQPHMFGVPYYYGYPYFPVMFLSYGPFLPIAAGYRAIRLGNVVWFLINLVAVAWLARRLAPRSDPLLVPLSALWAYSGILVWGNELFHLAVTDQLLSAMVLLALIALTYERALLAGLLLGLTQASKLFPGVWLLLVLFWWMWGNRSTGRFYASTLAPAVGIQLPFVLWNPAAYLSATILLYLTLSHPGNETSLYYFLPDFLKTPFLVVGALALLIYLGRQFLRPKGELSRPIGIAFSAALLFIAFGKQIHGNYLWAIYGWGCAVLVARVYQTGPEE